MIIARSVASGLGAAHLAGVVHRDLKPANIMVDADGEGLVMDFGVARSTSGPPAGGAAGTFPAGAVRAATAAQTMVGSVVGTVEYMAPEQARAEAVDQRADIYAFGLILYDLLLGRIRAQKTDSAIAELQRRMQESPPAPRTHRPDDSGGARQADRALHPDRCGQAVRDHAGPDGRTRQARRQGRAAAAGPAADLEDERGRGRCSWPALVGAHLLGRAGPAAAGRARAGLDPDQRPRRTPPATPR